VKPGLARSVAPRSLAAALVCGARGELDLTPKPGLVDLHDNGSHPDLDHAGMARSIELLPRYYEELIGLRQAWAPLLSCISAGRRAEMRMMEAIGANAHRGYIFLSGLVLLAACDDTRPLRESIAATAQEFFANGRPADLEGPGARARSAYGLGGIRAEALGGLPSVFEVGLPAYLTARDSWSADDASARGPVQSDDRARLGGDPHDLPEPDRVAFYALAALMQVVEDTTAVHRCGLGGLARLQRDGALLQARLERGEDPRPVLAGWNEEYRAMRLTMGGVADCLALVFSLAWVTGIPMSAGSSGDSQLSKGQVTNGARQRR
jgi:triphosphoribosyl-dephospho-CoA synthetase